MPDERSAQLRVRPALQQQPRDRLMFLRAAVRLLELDCPVQRAVLVRRRADHVRVGAGVEQLARPLDVAVVRGVHQRLPLHDLVRAAVLRELRQERILGGDGGRRLRADRELPPTRKAVLPRDGELRVREFRARVVCAQLTQPFLCELLQVFDAGTRRQGFRRGHETPSFFNVPGVRVSRARKKAQVVGRTSGGLNPSRGPSAACPAGFEDTRGRIPDATIIEPRGHEGHEDSDKEKCRGSHRDTEVTEHNQECLSPVPLCVLRVLCG
jgi:hypothetical protein